MALIVALFFVDSYYQILHCGASERALDLEALTDPPVRAAKYLNVNASITYANPITFGLYLGLLVISWVLGVLAVTVGESKPPIVTLQFDPYLQIPMLLLGLGFVGIIVFYRFRILTPRTGLNRDKPRRWLPGESARAKLAIPG